MAVGMDESIPLGIGLEMINRFDKGDPGFLGKRFGDPAAPQRFAAQGALGHDRGALAAEGRGGRVVELE